MSLQQEIDLLRQLKDALREVYELEQTIPKQKESTEKAIKALIDKDLPKGKKAPPKPSDPVAKPKHPKEPQMLTIEEKYGRKKPPINPLIPWFFWGVVRKKTMKEWQQAVDEENRKRTEKYERDCLNYKEREKEYKRQVENHKREMEKYAADLEAYQADQAKISEAKAQKRQENQKQYAQQIAQENAKVAALEQRLAEVRAAIQANPVLADQDKSMGVVSFVLEKLETRRADSVMAALNLYDDDRRKAQEFETKLRIDQMNREFEAEQRRWEQQERSRREAQQQFEQWSHNMEMKNLERERLKEQRRTNEELEMLRKATEGK